jgi:alkaline phosphatase D
LKTLKINNTIFVSGDSHASWSFDVTKRPTNYPSATTSYIPQAIPYNTTLGEGYTAATGEGSYAVEFCGPSVTSQNFDEILGAPLANAFNQIINNPIPSLENANYNPHMKYVDLSNHGYFILDVRADSTQADYFFVPNVFTNTTIETWARGVVTHHKSNRISNNNAQSKAFRKLIQDAPAPAPLVITTSVKSGDEAVIFTLFPNPTTNNLQVSYGLAKSATVSITITNMQGKIVKILSPQRQQTAGIYNISDYFVGDLTGGVYFFNIKTTDSTLTRKIIIQR